MNKIRTGRLVLAALLVISLVFNTGLTSYGFTGNSNEYKKEKVVSVNNMAPGAAYANEAAGEPAEAPAGDPTNGSDPALKEGDNPSSAEDPAAASTPSGAENPTAAPTEAPTSEPTGAPAPTVTISGDDIPTPTPTEEPAKEEDTEADKDEEDESSLKKKLNDLKDGLLGTLGVPAEGAGEDTTWQEDFTYYTNGSDIILSKYNGNAEELVIPEYAVIDGKKYKSKLYKDCRNFFSYKTSLNSIDLSKVDSNDVTNMSYMFMYCRSLTSLDLSGFNTLNVTDMSNMFFCCVSLTSLNLSGFNTSNVTDMSYMFSGCSSLTSLDLSGFNTYSVTNMRNMFGGCSLLKSLDLRNFYTSNVTNMTNMFESCGSLTSLDLRGVNTSNVTDMSRMFYYCGRLTNVDLSSFNTSNVTNMGGMFYYCSSLTGLDLSSFNTSNVMNMNSMFYNCNSLTGLDLSSFNTSNVTDMSEMFSNCKSLTSLNLSSFNMSNVKNMDRMFNACTALQQIEIPLNVQVDAELPATFVKKTDPSIEYTSLPKNETSSYTIVRKNSDTHVTGVTVDPTDKTIEIGTSFTISANVIPADAADKSVTWSSGDPSVATVDSNGVVTGIAEGETRILVRTNDGNKEAVCTVKVIKKKIPVIGITVDPTDMTINVGDDFIIIPTISPDDASDMNINWSSDDTSVATVNKNGLVIGIGPGQTVITATTEDGGKTATCTVTVKSVPVTGITLNKQSLTMYIDDTETLTATITPYYATDKSVTWSSDNTGVAEVDQKGRITARAVGTAIITVRSNDSGVEDYCIVTVLGNKTHVTGITVNPTSKTIYVGDLLPIKAEVMPADATDKSVNWSSDDPSVASVYNGSVRGIAPGQTTIRAITNDGGYEAVCIITVMERPVEVTSITVIPDEYQIFVTEKYTLTAKILPDNATDKTVTWTSNNPAVATVDSTGMVTGISVGEAIITATASNGKNATCRIKVIRMPVRVTEIYVTPIVKTIYVGQSFTVTATVLPRDADVTDVVWTSNKASIASVDSKGKVLGKSVGVATITATTVDGGYTAECIVTVIEKPSPVPPTTYKLYILDWRTKDAPHKEMVRATVDYLAGDRYLIMNDSDGNKIKPLINGDSSLPYDKIVFYDLRLTDVGGNDKSDFGKCTIRIPLIDDMDVHNGSVRVVSMIGDGIDKSISSSTGTENSVDYVTFTTGHFTEFAILYKLKKNDNNSSTGTTTDYTNYYNNLYAAALNNAALTANYKRVLDSVPRTGDYRTYLKKNEED